MRIADCGLRIAGLGSQVLSVVAGRGTRRLSGGEAAEDQVELVQGIPARFDHRPAQTGVLPFQRRGQPGHDQGGLAGAGRPQHGQEVVLGQPLSQPGNELLPAKEEGPLLVTEGGQTLEGAACIVGGRLLAQRQGVEAQVQRFRR